MSPQKKKDKKLPTRHLSAVCCRKNNYLGDFHKLDLENVGVAGGVEGIPPTTTPVSVGQRSICFAQSTAWTKS